MDRDQQDNLPSMQIGFIDSICLPLYKVIFLKIIDAINNNCAHLKKNLLFLVYMNKNKIIGFVRIFSVGETNLRFVFRESQSVEEIGWFS